MSIDFSSGTFFMEQKMIGYMTEINSVKSDNFCIIKPIFLNKNSEMKFECSMSITEELFNMFCELCPYTIKGSLLIMIQTRWHKKARIRKKWLKRYGMNLDKIDFEIPNIITGQMNINDNEFNFETSEIIYKFRPDQLRRGIEIKMI